MSKHHEIDWAEAQEWQNELVYITSSVIGAVEKYNSLK